MKANNPNLKKNFTKLSNFTLDLYCPEYFLKETRICCNQAVVAFFYNILKVVLVLLRGGPPLPPPPLRGGAGLSARRLCKICRGSFAKTNSLLKKKWKKWKFLKFFEIFLLPLRCAAVTALRLTPSQSKITK